MSSQFTKGPWVALAPRTIMGVDKNTIGFASYDGKTDAEMFANARLMAAAPEMLEVLEMIISGQDKNLFSKKLYATLNKAKGLS